MRAFNGQYGRGTMACSDGTSQAFTSGTILNGTIQGNTVTFDLDSPDYHQTGTVVSGNASMSGSATWRFIDPSTGTINTYGGNLGRGSQLSRSRYKTTLWGALETRWSPSIGRSLPA